MRGRATVAERIMLRDFCRILSIAEVARRAGRSHGPAAATPETEAESVGHGE